LKIGDSKVFNLWIHEQKDYSSVITGGTGSGGGGGGGGGGGVSAGTGGVLFNWSLWPGVVAGDLIRIQSVGIGIGGNGHVGYDGKEKERGERDKDRDRDREKEKEDESFLFVVEDDHCTKPQLQVSSFFFWRVIGLN